MAEPGDFFVGTLRDHDDEKDGRIPLSKRRHSSQDAAGAAAAAPAGQSAQETAGINMTHSDDASIDDSLSFEARRRKSGGSTATSLCTLQALADMCLSDTEMDLDDNNDGSSGSLVPKVNTTPDRTRSRSARKKEEQKEAENTGIGGTLRRHVKRLSSIYSAAAYSGDDDSSSSDEEEEKEGFESSAYTHASGARPASGRQTVRRRASLPMAWSGSLSSFGYLEQGMALLGNDHQPAVMTTLQHKNPPDHVSTGVAPVDRTQVRRSSLPPNMPTTISYYDARTAAPTGAGAGDRRRSSYHTAGSEGSGTTTADRHNDSSSSSSRSTLYDDDGGLGLQDGLEGLGTIPTRCAPKQKVLTAVSSVCNDSESSRPIAHISKQRPLLLQALVVAALAAICGFGMILHSGGRSKNGYLPSSFDLFHRKGGHRQLEGIDSLLKSVASTAFGRHPDATPAVDEKPFVASVLDRMLGPTKDSGEGDTTEQRNVAVMSPASESDTERTSALMTMRRRRRWRRRWTWHQTGGNPNDKAQQHRQPTREGMKKFRAAVRLYKPRYFKWIRDVGQKGRAVCTFDSKEEETAIEGDSVDADSKGGDSKDGNTNQDDGGNNNKDNIFDRPAGKGKGKGYYAERDQYYHNNGDASDDFAVKNSKGSKGSKGSVRFICFA